MKSKKPFLIVCAAALTLLLLISLFGVSAFAATMTELSNPVSVINFDSDITYVHPSSNLSYPSVLGNEVVGYVVISGVNRTFVQFRVQSTTNASVLYIQFNSSEGLGVIDVSGHLISDWDGIIHFNSPVTLYSSLLNWYNGQIPPPPPPDPLAPVSDGIDTVISVFGDVIDYIINTPDVAIFVAISVASCAIIPMGIILIKKLIKGY